MKLRPYQDKLIGDIRGSIRAGNRDVLAVLPTGGGKTVIASHLARNVSARGHAFWFICHRDFLIDQTAKTFRENNIDFGIVAAGRKMHDRPVQICSIDTLKNRLDLLEAPYVRVWDECHHLRAAGWMMVHDAHDAIDIGLTATPQRLDGKGLRPPFTEMVQGPDTAYLMSIGALSDYRAYSIGHLDLSAVRTTAGDYNLRDLNEAMGAVIVGDVVQTYLDRAAGKRFLYFCHNIAASQALAEAFKRAGVRALHVDGETSTSDRIAAALLFATGKLDVLTNCSLFGEGYDLAAQCGTDVTVEGVGLVRPTQSLALHRQQIGRCLRPKAEPALILDHVGNIEAHGLPDSPIDWSLDGRTDKQKQTLTRMCKHCSAINRPSATMCVDCGRPLSAGNGSERPGPRRMDGELQEVDREAKLAMERAQRSRALDEIAACRTHEDFIELGRKRGYKPQWAHIQWKLAKEKAHNQATAYLRGYQ